MSSVRIQTAGHFGVDRGRPVIDDQEPDEVLVLKGDQVLTFEVEDPDLETGRSGTGVAPAGIIAYAGPSYSRRTWDASDGPPGVMYDDGLVTVPTTVSRVRRGPAFDMRHTVIVSVPDGASPANRAATSFTFIRDTKVPTFAVSKSSRTSATRVRPPCWRASAG